MAMLILEDVFSESSNSLLSETAHLEMVYVLPYAVASCRLPFFCLDSTLSSVMPILNYTV